MILKLGDPKAPELISQTVQSELIIVLTLEAPLR